MALHFYEVQSPVGSRSQPTCETIKHNGRESYNFKPQQMVLNSTGTAVTVRKPQQKKRPSRLQFRLSAGNPSTEKLPMTKTGGWWKFQENLVTLTLLMIQYISVSATKLQMQRKKTTSYIAGGGKKNLS